MTASLVPAAGHKPFMYLVIKNRGRTQATNIKVSFEPTLPKDTVQGLIMDRYEHRITQLPPGQELLNIYCAAPKGERGWEDAKDALDNPDGNKLVRRGFEEPVYPCVTVFIEYGSKLSKKPLNGEFVLRPREYMLHTYSQPNAKKNVALRRTESIESVAWETWRSNS